MRISDRIAQAEQKFEELKTQREEHLKAAEDCSVEMTKLQGEYRVLQDLLETETTKVNKKATVIEAVPEGAVK